MTGEEFDLVLRGGGDVAARAAVARALREVAGEIAASGDAARANRLALLGGRLMAGRAPEERVARLAAEVAEARRRVVRE